MKHAVCVLLVLVAFGPRQGAAGEPDPNRLFNQALKLAQQGNTEKAVVIWHDVLDRVEPRYRPSVHKALGLGYGKLGRLPEAAYHIQRFLESQMDAEAADVRQRLSEIEVALAADHFKVTVGCQPAGAYVYLQPGEEAIPYPCPLAWWFEKGKHKLLISAAGFEPGTVEFDTAADSAQQLVTVVLNRLGEGRSGPNAEEITRKLRQAAKAGHTSVVRKLVMRHPDVARKLPCKNGWEPALRGVSQNVCRTELVETLVAAGVTVCATQTELKKAMQAGCSALVALILENMSDLVVADSVGGFSLAGIRFTAAERSMEILKGIALAEERLQAACGKESAGDACRVLKHLRNERKVFLVSLAKAGEEESVLRVLSAYPALARLHHCTMVQSLMAPGAAGEACERRTGRLKRFYQPGPLDCSMSTPMANLVRTRCARALEVLARDVVTEDLAAGCREFNKGDLFIPLFLDAPGYERDRNTSQVARALLEEAGKRCKKEGLASPACEGARRVKSELSRIKKERKRISSPKALLGELCLYQRVLDESSRKLEKIRRRHALAGLTTHPEISIQAEYVINAQDAIDLLSELYRQASKKTFKPSMCR